MYIIYIIYDINNHMKQKKIEREDCNHLIFKKSILNKKQKIKLKKKI